jgi:hypothetical protein
MNSAIAVEVVRPQSGEAATQRNLPLGYLRGFVTLLVVAHHAFLAYHSYAPPHPRSLTQGTWWTAFPISDSQKWPGIEAFIGFNDVFFMSLMFLISGVFVPASLLRKGSGLFVRDRLLKLGIPFAVGSAVLAPLAYLPSYLAGARESSFWGQWLALDFWPSGPVWFLWVLIALGVIAAGIQTLHRGWFTKLATISGSLGAQPAIYFAALFAASALAYTTLALLFTPEHWFTLGPFAIQSSRVLHYAVYFFAGIGLGAYGTGKGLLAPDGKLARRWYVWSAFAALAFVVVTVATIVILGTLQSGGPGAALSIIGNVCFALSCAASSIALTAAFLRFSQKASAFMDSLSANAYGIYLLHYFCVSWLQLMLLPAAMSGALKATIVFAGATAASWGLTAILRRVPAFGRVL